MRLNSRKVTCSWHEYLCSKRTARVLRRREIARTTAEDARVVWPHMADHRDFAVCYKWS